MSQEIQEAVYKQQEVIKDKQLSVKQDLDQVEPAVIEAQNGTVVYFLTAVFIVDLLSQNEYNTLVLQGFFLFIPVPAFLKTFPFFLLQCCHIVTYRARASG